MDNEVQTAIALAKKLKKANMLPADLPQHKYSEGQKFLVAYASFLMTIANSGTRDHYRLVLNHFMRFMENMRDTTPLNATGIDISVWRNDLQRTGGIAGVYRSYSLSKYNPQSKSSIENKTSILSAFFKYLQKPGMDGSPPLINSNPVEALHTRFKIEKWGNSKKIDKATFIKCIAQINRTTVKGKRDYALMFGYYMTGRRNSEWVNLRWGDINFNRNPPVYSFVRKGQKDTKDEMPDSLMKAIFDYLETRYGPDFRLQLRPDSYLFTALPGKGGERQKQNPNNPLTERYMLKLVKGLAKKAGIPHKNITVHSLRHLHAEVYLEAGASVEEVRARLRHESLATTQRYVSSMDNEKNRLAEKLEQMLEE